MKRFNLSEWALTHRSLVLYAMIVLGIIGAWSYRHLGQSEDPPFTFMVMTIGRCFSSPIIFALTSYVDGTPPRPIGCAASVAAASAIIRCYRRCEPLAYFDVREW